MAILFKDTFTDVDGTALTAHTPDITTNGLVWKMFGTAVAKITGNEAYFTTINSYGPAHVELNLQNFAVQVKYVTVTTLSVVMMRYVDNSNWLGLVKEAENGRITLKKRVTGTFTVLWDSGNLAVVAGDTVRAEHEGTTVRVYINGVLKATVTNVTENLGTMQRVGFASPDATPSNARWDDFQVEDLTTESPGTTYTASGSAAGTSSVSATPPTTAQAAVGSSNGASQFAPTEPSRTQYALGTATGLSAVTLSAFGSQTASGSAAGISTAAATPMIVSSASGQAAGVSAANGDAIRRLYASGQADSLGWAVLNVPRTGNKRSKRNQFGLLQ